MFKTGLKKLISFIPPELIALLVIFVVTATLMSFALGKVSFPSALKQNQSDLVNPSPISVASLDPKTIDQILGEKSDANGSTSAKSSPFISPQPTPTPYSSQNNLTRQVYPIIPLGDISSLPDNQKAQMIAIYNDFRNTPNLQYMTYDQQQEIFKQKAGVYLDAYKIQLQQQASQLQTEINQLKTQQGITANTYEDVNPLAEAKLAELQQTLDTIYHQPIAMNVIYGKMQRAYQDWIRTNSQVYSTILGSNKYSNQLTGILASYGL